MSGAADGVAIALRINGQNHRVVAEPRRLLSDVLREDCGLTGTHVGCEHGVCGACTVLLDGAPVRACLIYAIQAQRHDITTIEAFGTEALSPVQQALHEEHGLQCGFCTPGIVVTMEAWLAENPEPSEAEIREALSGNLCRCTGYHNIVAAIAKAAARRREDTAATRRRGGSAT
jgi:aerobic carbon-monoxide dehydrogenase small subunit